jgi:MFS family permease
MLSSPTFAAFRSRDFRLLWFGNLLSNSGGWMQRVAQPWLVLSLSQSPFLLGLDAFAADAPLIALLLFGGVIADRGNRRLIITVSQTIQMSSAALIAFLAFTGRAEVWMIISLSFLIGTVQSFSIPAYQALVPALVPRAHLSNAIALNSTQFNLSRIIGPALAGLVMAGLGIGWCFALNSFSFLALIFAVRAIEAPRHLPAKGEAASLRSGIRSILGDRDLATLILIIASTSLLCGPLLTFIPVLARDVHGSGPEGFSLLLSVFGLGALVGAVFIASADQGKLGVRTVLGCAFVLSTMVIGTSLAPSLAWAGVLLFAAGLAFIGCNAVANTLLQSRVGDELRGRAASLFVLSFRGALPIGNLISGLTVDRLGVSRALCLNGVLALLSLLLIARRDRLAT